MNNNEIRKQSLYNYKLEQTTNAAIAFADACDRCGAEYNRLSIVQFCVNSFPEITGKDALDIAQLVRGRNIQCD